MTYNNDVLDNLSYIEQNGIQTESNLVYSEYNIYTSTGRPSNRYLVVLTLQLLIRKKMVVENHMLVDIKQVC